MLESTYRNVRVRLKELRNMIGGWRDYHRHPDQRDRWGGPFNGLPFRCALFHALLKQIEPEAIFETGTYRGVTTEYLAKTGLPVFTFEADYRNFGFAFHRLWRGARNIKMLLGDSRTKLRLLLDGRLRALRDRNLFFYLDSHWEDDLPLADELEIIFSRCSRAVVMIDDFVVPGDPGYLYDDYGPGKVLNADYIAAAVAKFDLSVFYPSTPSEKEGRTRRGCVVIAKKQVHGDALRLVPLLRQA